MSNGKIRMWVFVDDSPIDLVPKEEPEVSIFTTPDAAENAFKESLLRYLSPYTEEAEKLFSSGEDVYVVYREMNVAGDLPQMFVTSTCVDAPIHVQPEDVEDDDPERMEAIRELARGQHIDSAQEVSIDEGAVVSEGDDNGAWVGAWVWASFSGTEFDKASDEEE